MASSNTESEDEAHRSPGCKDDLKLTSNILHEINNKELHFGYTSVLGDGNKSEQIFHYGSHGDKLEDALCLVPPTNVNDSFIKDIKAALLKHPSIRATDSQINKLKKQIKLKKCSEQGSKIHDINSGTTIIIDITKNSFSNPTNNLKYKNKTLKFESNTDGNFESVSCIEVCNSRQEISEKNREKYVHLLNELCSCSDSAFEKVFLIFRKEFLEILPQVDNLQDSLPQVVMVLFRVCKSESSFRNSHLPSLVHNAFLERLIAYITLLPIDYNEERMQEKMLINFFENTLVFCKVANEMSFKCRGIIRKIALSIQFSIKGLKDYQNIDISTSAFKQTDIMETCNGLISCNFDQERKSTVSRYKKKTLIDENSVEPPDNISTIDIFPTKFDLSESSPFLRKNVIEGSYRDVEHYIDVQFRLLREDFIAPLRIAIQQYRQETNGQYEFDNVVIHEGVKILYGTIVNGKFGHLVKLSKRKNSVSRLMFGSLLLFTSNKFNSFLCATVINPVNEELLIIDLCSESVQAGLSDIYESVFTMIETEIYFEPYYHVLNTLQQIDVDTFPMKEYIVDVQTNVECSGPLSDHTGSLNLNEAQQKAFIAAMNNDFVVIQGPPGTGKTHLAKTITKEILEDHHKRCSPEFSDCIGSKNDTIYGLYTEDDIHDLHYGRDDGYCTFLQSWLKFRQFSHLFFPCEREFCSIPPILIVCYTNHALDQFLEGLLPYTNKIVRVGGQSKCASLEKFNLKEIRKCWVQSQKEARRSCSCFDCKHSQSSKQHFEHMSAVKGIAFKYFKIQRLIEKVFESGLLKMSTLHLYMQHKFRNVLHSDRFEFWLLQGMYNNIPFSENPNNIDSSHVNISILTNELRKSTAYEHNLEMYNIDNFEVLADIEVNEHFSLKLSILQVQNCNIQSKLRKHQSRGGCERLSNIYRAQIEETDKKCRYIAHMLSLNSQVDIQKIKELVKTSNIWSLDHHDRWMLYHSWVQNYICDLKCQLMNLEEELVAEEIRFKQIQDELDKEILRSADIVGMTTTSAARLRDMLVAVGPEIVIVEEAAEVLEAHIIASLTPTVEKVILIGDHKQLKPSTAVYELAKQYNLDVSLFERMIKNGLGCQVLDTQHRMRPEIASLITPAIYPNLVNGEKVFDRPDIRGVASNVFFVNHNHPEDKISESRSRSNAHEVGFVISLCQYLLDQFYSSSSITILATYAGQMTELERERRHRHMQEVRITTVDNFQGEENEIILLSLVRSNPNAQIGFLSAENRVCVALSRARNGLYIIGNMNNLTQSSSIWPKIKTQLETMNAIGPALPLGCRKHPNSRSRVACRDDFKGLPSSGCHVRCATELLCGHMCPEYCHSLDPDHEAEFSCKEACERMTCEEHRCPKRCGKICGQCSVKVEKLLPCGHSTLMICSGDPESHKCSAKVTVILKTCGHPQDRFCSTRKEFKKCLQPCTVVNTCGHMCTSLCHVHLRDVKMPCSVLVRKTFICDHSTLVACESKDSTLLKCKEPCTKVLPCGHPCLNNCGETCKRCDVLVEKTLPCGHEQVTECWESPENVKCQEPCELELPCGHPCVGSCAQPCSATSCEEIVRCDVEPQCGHGFIYLPCHLNRQELKSNSDTLLQYCTAPCRAEMACGHTCSGRCGPCVQGSVHVPCANVCTKTLPCGHRCKEVCGAECPALCNQPCLYSCEHRKCTNICGMSCSPCKKPCVRQCPHQKCSRTCSEPCDCPPCELPCPQTLPCGHPCAGFCGELCPQDCPLCSPAAFQFRGYNVEPNHRFVVLDDCHHSVEETMLKRLNSLRMPRLLILQCPVCSKQITRSRRLRETMRALYLNVKRSRDLKREMITSFVRSMKSTISYTISTESCEKYGDAAFFILNHLKKVRIQYKTTEYIYNLFEKLTSSFTEKDKEKSTLILERRKVLLKALSLRVKSMSSWDFKQIESEIKNVAKCCE